MSKCVDFQDVRQCVKYGIEHGWTLSDFLTSMDMWTDFIQGYRWRKCSEEMPEEYMTYEFDLDSMSEYPSGICKSPIVNVTVRCEESGEPEYFVNRGYTKDGVWYEPDGFGETEIPFPVTAWMTLPDPYTEDE